MNDEKQKMMLDLVDRIIDGDLDGAYKNYTEQKKIDKKEIISEKIKMIMKERNKQMAHEMKNISSNELITNLILSVYTIWLTKTIQSYYSRAKDFGITDNDGIQIYVAEMIDENLNNDMAFIMDIISGK